MHILLSEIDNCPFLSQWKGENDRRNYFMINLHERMLLDVVGTEPTTPDHQSNAHLSHEASFFMKTYVVGTH